MMRWTILTDRLGSDTRDPSEEKVLKVIDDLHASEGDEDHFSITVRSGVDDGEMRVLDLTRRGHLTYSVYSDADFENLVNETTWPNIGIHELRRFFLTLTAAKIEEFDSLTWPGDNAPDTSA